MFLEGLFANGKPSKKEVKKILKRKKRGKTLCYVLITCSEPNEDGSYEVEMSYDGDKWLAAYLVESAGSIFANKSSDQRY